MSEKIEGKKQELRDALTSLFENSTLVLDHYEQNSTKQEVILTCKIVQMEGATVNTYDYLNSLNLEGADSLINAIVDTQVGVEEDGGVND